VINKRRMRWAGHVERMGEMRSAHRFLSENLKGRDHSEDMDVDGTIILQWILDIKK
jgi:hypothetical protein